MCCCAKSTKDKMEDTPYGGNIEYRLKNMSRLMIEFISEEHKIGLREVTCQ